MGAYIITVRSDMDGAILERVTFYDKEEAEAVYGMLTRLIDFAVIEKSWRG